MRKNFNKKLLDEYININNIILVGNYDDNVNRDTVIKGQCLKNCGNTFEKKFRYLYENGGAYCSNCIKQTSQEKSKKTCLENYGVEHTFQSENNKNKSK